MEAVKIRPPPVFFSLRFQKNMNYYRQCHLQKGNQFQDTWLPEKFAVVGKYLKLQNAEDKTWEDGWKVTGVYHRLDEKAVLINESQYRTHRDTTDA